MPLTTAILAAAVSAGPLLGYWDFAVYDADADGYVTPAELEQTGMFTVWDGDDDDYLNPGQIGDPNLFREWDDDGNDLLGRAEFYTGVLESFDFDDDGVLSEEEWDRIEIFE